MSDVPVSSSKIQDPRLQNVLEISDVPAKLPMSYRHWIPSSPERLAIFLHGFADHGGSFLRRLFPKGWPSELDNVGLLAPNGLFPVPVRTEEGWREAYSWYFFDEAKMRMLISPDFAVSGIKMLLRQYGLEGIPKTIIGFSQGGFLAPYLAKHIEGVSEIIAVGSGFRADFYEVLPADKIRLTAIHGDQDEIFPIAAAEKSHRHILDLGFKGDFVSIPGVRHIATPEIGVAISQRLTGSQEKSK